MAGRGVPPPRPPRLWPAQLSARLRREWDSNPRSRGRGRTEPSTARRRGHASSQSLSGLPGAKLSIGYCGRPSRGEARSHWLSAAEGRGHPPSGGGWAAASILAERRVWGSRPGAGGAGPGLGRGAQIRRAQPELGGPAWVGGSELGSRVPARIGAFQPRRGSLPGAAPGLLEDFGVQPLGPARGTRGPPGVPPLGGFGVRGTPEVLPLRHCKGGGAAFGGVAAFWGSVPRGGGFGGSPH